MNREAKIFRVLLRWVLGSCLVASVYSARYQAGHFSAEWGFLGTQGRAFFHLHGAMAVEVEEKGGPERVKLVLAARGRWPGWHLRTS